jgi:hypothetical protein
VSAPGSMTRYGLLKTTAVMSLPTTLPRRLMLLGTMCLLVGALIPDVTGASWVTGAGLAVFLLAFGAAVRPRRGDRHWGRLASARYGMIRLLRVMGLLVITPAGITLALAAIAFAPRSLAFMAASGNGGFGASSTGPLGSISVVVGAAMLGILLWPPQLFFRLQLDIDGSGSAQRVLLRLITATACGLTGTDILLLHFGGGPLSRIGIGPLIAGMIGTTLLLAPIYWSVARACWLHGVAGLVYPRTLRRHWASSFAELREAIERCSRPGANNVSTRPARDEQMPIAVHK